jgi:hypothetical protein
MKDLDIFAPGAHALLSANGLASFGSLWALGLPLVDEPNTSRGGISRVSRLPLGGQAFYLKRQANHLSRSLFSPFGEPTFARECRMIARYAACGVPALRMAYYGQRSLPEGRAAILLTFALSGWQSFDKWLAHWADVPQLEKTALIDAAGRLVARLHAQGLCHGACYPKHIFLRPQGEAFEACFIDLEKTHPLLCLARNRVKDLEQFARHLPEADTRQFLAAYLGVKADAPEAGKWLKAVLRRKADKAGRP